MVPAAYSALRSLFSLDYGSDGVVWFRMGSVTKPVSEGLRAMIFHFLSWYRLQIELATKIQIK